MLRRQSLRALTAHPHAHRRCLSTGPAASHAVFHRYRALVDDGAITYDSVQVRAVRHLDVLFTQLADYGGPSAASTEASLASVSWWQRLTSSANAETDVKTAGDMTPRGLYIHGGVGCGKTFVMDMFFDAVPIVAKKRVHFHKFMLDIHKKMHELRKQGRHEDPIPFIIDELLRDSWLLCFDEFQVTDVADALILRRLFSALLERGFVMVATSNRPPSGVHHAHNVYNFPLAPEARERFDSEFEKYRQGEALVETHLTTQGRRVRVPLAAIERGVCQFSFKDLCEKPLGAADYIAIADAFPVVFVRDVPVLKFEMMNQLHCLAEASAINLYQVAGDQKAHIDEVFAFDRTVSRLLEMGSEAYLKAHSQKHGSLDESEVDEEGDEESDALLFTAATHMTLNRGADSNACEAAVG
ncbi:hypothetical protein PybrP1_009242 [[Pythium] brassicae (nom. inval.)]|nr:hypothetical protein PybrP1_009242 [[Pythium] brassicae (nom. inval.)]